MELAAPDTRAAVLAARDLLHPAIKVQRQQHKQQQASASLKRIGLCAAVTHGVKWPVGLHCF